MPPAGVLACNPGMCPDRKSNGDPLVCRPALNPLSHTSQGSSYFEIRKISLTELTTSDYSKKQYSVLTLEFSLLRDQALEIGKPISRVKIPALRLTVWVAFNMLLSLLNPIFLIYKMG